MIGSPWSVRDHPCIAILLTLGLSAPVAVNAQVGPVIAEATGADAIAEKAGKVLVAYRIGDDAPLLDGILDDPVWLLADSVDDLIQWEPDNMAPATERTVIRVAYDDRYLYVAARLHDGDPAGIRGGLGRRDAAPPSDALHVGFDPQHDHLTGYVFSVNPSGVQSESYFFDDTNNDGDYNSVWEVAARVDEGGWSAEYRIPFSQMRFRTPVGKGVVWGFGLRRSIHRKNEHAQWVGRPRGETGQVSRWGHLVFEERVPSPRRLELLPFGAARRNAANGLPSEHALEGGLDMRLGLGSSATLSGTVNPDFGQVEADPAVLNLSVFETFFPEKRPFFLEDRQIFVPPYGLFQLFHSRRIGNRPGYFNSIGGRDVLLERPDQTTILGAAKVTGKGRGFTYGGVSALTAAETAVVDSMWDDGIGSSRLERLIEPTTSFNALRVQRDVLGGSSNIGVLATGVMREGAPDAFTGGVDYKLRWGRNRWQWNGHWAVSDAPGPDGRSTGVGGVTNFNYNGKHWDAGVHLDHFAPSFRINDIGFLRTRVDRTGYAGWVGYGNPDPGRVLRSWGLNLNAGESRNTGNLLLERDVYLGGQIQLLSFWGVFGNVGISPGAFDDLETRGGPPVVSPGSVNWFMGLNSDPRKSWSLSVAGSGSHSRRGGWRAGLAPSLDLRPSPRVQLGIRASYDAALDEAQWIANRDVDGDQDVDHVFGRLRTDVVNITVRGTVAINRDLTFQGFLQPFVAVGDYTTLMRLARPSSFDFDPIASEQLGYDPDFNSKSLRGTLVMRWEYVRGSTLFFVWNLAGRDRERPGVFDPLRDLGDSFAASRDNAFMIKANYWLSL